AEADREDLQPVIEEVEEDLAPGDQPARLEHGKIGGKADGEGREDDVKRHREGKLCARQRDRIKAIEHRAPSIFVPARCLARALWRWYRRLTSPPGNHQEWSEIVWIEGRRKIERPGKGGILSGSWRVLGG